jgi:hypothetical protein
MLCPVSLTAGEFGMTGLLWTLMLGDTALRLKRLGSKSSSRRRFRLISVMAGKFACGVELLDPGRSYGLANSAVLDPSVVDGVISMAISSSDMADGPNVRIEGGGVR